MPASTIKQALTFARVLERRLASPRYVKPTPLVGAIEQKVRRRRFRHGARAQAVSRSHSELAARRGRPVGRRFAVSAGRRLRIGARILAWPLSRVDVAGPRCVTRRAGALAVPYLKVSVVPPTATVIE